MKLYFLRHGPARDRLDWKGDDSERPLTEKGRDLMQRSAAAIARRDLDLEAVLTSPAARAYQTASIVAEALHAAHKLRIDGRLGPGFGKGALAAILQDYPGSGSLMLVGHEPGMSEAISALIGGGRIVCKKGGLACVKLIEPSSLKGERLWSIPPSFLAQKP